MSENWVRSFVFDEGQKRDYRHLPGGLEVFYVRLLRALFVWFQCGVGFYLLLSKPLFLILGELCSNILSLFSLRYVFFGHSLIRE